MKLHQVMDSTPFGTIYIAGPMTGIPDLNRPAFEAVRDDLAGLFPNADVVSPPDLDGEGEWAWEACLRRDLKIVVDAVAVVAMEGWECSRGAALEVRVATELGIPVFRYPSFQRVI